MTLILAGDIGGTRARFALCDAKSRRVVHEEVLESRTFTTFEKALARFLEVAKKAVKKKLDIRAATFGIAGPVVNQRVKTTNLPWVIDGTAIEKSFDLGPVTLFNDLVAIGFGALASPANKVKVLRLGRPKKAGGNIAVIAAGTGLGEAIFVWDGKRHVPCATEGAHVDFAPRNDVEADLLASLRAEHGHVSYERVASGSTIGAVYRFFVHEQGVKESKEAAAKIAQSQDPNPVIVDLAEKGKSEAAMRAIELWSGVYGSEAGNLALKGLAMGGVYICGGVSGRLANVLANGLAARRTKKKSLSPFLEGFIEKGRMRHLLEKMPIALCTEPRAGLIGAAAHASSVLQS